MELYTRINHLYRLTLGGLITFNKNPSPGRSDVHSTRQKIGITFGLFVIKLLFSVSVASLLGLFYEPQNLTDDSMANRFGPWTYLLVGGMILPVFEETLFRLSLVFKPLYLSLSMMAASYYIGTKLIFQSRLSSVDESFLLRVGISMLIGLSLVLPA